MKVCVDKPATEDRASMNSKLDEIRSFRNRVKIIVNPYVFSNDRDRLY